MAIIHNDRAAYVQALQLEGHTREGDYYVYNWPAAANGTRYERFIVIEEFSDGSASVYLAANALTFDRKLAQLRAMVRE